MNASEKLKDELDRNIWEKSRINYHREYIENLLECDLEESDEKVNWNDIIEDHLIKISQFQHERLIHLIVTVLFALLTIISIGFMYMFENIFFVLLTLCLIILLIPYIFYYYMLENNTQAMYELYDQLLKKKKAVEEKE